MQSRTTIATSLVVLSAISSSPLSAQTSVLLEASPVNECVADGFGNTPDLNFSYQISAGFGMFNALTGSDCVRGWPGPGWGELDKNFWSVGSRGPLDSDEVIQITAVATSASTLVDFESISLGKYFFRGGPDFFEVQVFDLSGNQLFRESKSVGEQISFLSYPTVDFSASGVSATGGLIVQFGANPYWVGASDLRFTVGRSNVLVPEPSRLAMLLVAGLGLVAFRVRRFA